MQDPHRIHTRRTPCSAVLAGRCLDQVNGRWNGKDRNDVESEGSGGSVFFEAVELVFKGVGAALKAFFFEGLLRFLDGEMAKIMQNTQLLLTPTSEGTRL